MPRGVNRFWARRAAHAVIAAALALLLAPAPARPQAPRYDPALYQAMHWRNLGPFRGGRSVAVAGVASDPQTYFFGAVGGGVWKTEDAGRTWRNVSDGELNTSSVGALAVAESDPNVVYAGMGEHAVRGVTTSHGDGVYRSTDGGETWTHLGLEETRHISRIRVHPRDPDVVYVAAQGAVYGPSEARGVYRSTDGGRTWEKVLYVDENTGASDLAMDMTNPRVLYAALWDHRRYPWTVHSGGPGSGVYKSTDGGETWQKLTNGLPEVMGKVAVSISRADPDRVYALIEADGGGLFRSDDGGRSWTRVNADRVLRARAWYYIEVYADPQDPETVYVLNAPMLRSTDGGRTFDRIPTPHGDNHDLWINPRDNRYMINANDGGANVSLNGGESWSTQRNQPTAQFYRVNVDNRFPYHVYGGQQDNSTVAIASWSADGGLDWKDWYAVGGCESAYTAFDPDEPRYVYAGCYQGQITEYDQETRTLRNVMAYPYLGLGTRPRDVKYRFNWNAPILVSAHDPRVIYHAGNVLLRSDDRGRTWREVSPDLTRDEVEKQGPGGGPFTNEGAGGEVYNTIMYVAESPHDPATLWAGSDDGLVHVTRDGGRTWTDVTPGGVGEAMINSIEVSPHDPATAYVVVTRYKFNDFTPRIYKTTDYGEDWERVVDGIPDGAWVRVVREDPVRPGLLYAGTELGMYVSFDGGEGWQSLQLDLPLTPITDLKVKDDDLVAATQGRGFWVLDDLSPLRQLTDEVAEADAHLFRPAAAHRLSGGGGSAGPREGENPPAGAVLYYTLSEAPGEPLSLEILDDDGAVVRRLSSAEPADTVEMPSGDFVPERLPARAGLNRFVWDLRHDPLTPVPDLFIMGSLEGRRVAPGRYRVRLTAAGQTLEQPLEVLPDPRLAASPADYAEQQELLAAIDESVNAIHASVVRMRTVRTQVEGILELLDGSAGAAGVDSAGAALVDAMATWESGLVQTRTRTFQDVINFENQLNAHLLYLKEQVDGMEPPVTAGARQRLRDLEAEWERRKTAMRRILTEELPAFNRLLRSRGVGPVIVPETEVVTARRES